MEKEDIICWIIALLIIWTWIWLLIRNDQTAEKMQQQYELGYVKWFNSCVLSILDSKK
jgi:hypothetical protein